MDRHQDNEDLVKVLNDDRLQEEWKEIKEFIKRFLIRKTTPNLLF